MGRKRLRQDGVALIMTVAVVAIAMMVTTTAVAVVLSNVADARRANAMTTTRAAAEAGADEVFARVVRNPAYFVLGTNGGPAPYTQHPAYTPNWATLVNGSPQPCTDAYRQVCYQVGAKVDSQPGDPYAGAVTVEVTAATLCLQGLSSLVTCVTTTVHQRLVQRQFFDYLYFDMLETLDPLLYPTAADQDRAASSCDVLASARPHSCTRVPFLGGDVVYGPVHTNDDSFAVCLSPRFEPPLTRSGWPSTKSSSGDPTSLESTGSSVFVAAPDRACSGSRPSETNSVTEAAMSPYYSFAVDVTDLRAIANPPDVYDGTTTITLSTSSYHAAPGPQPPGAGAARAWPGRGVIFVSGDVYVSGDACAPISIAATGSVFVQGDLTYSCPESATGLEADDAVVVLPTNGPSGTPVNSASDRTIEAAVLALGKHSCRTGGTPPAPGVSCGAATGDPLRGGSFYVLGWDTTTLRAGATPHYLHFLGAIASIWRGAIGGFDPTSGQLVSGWAKDFSFDRQLRTSQPPYFLAPVGAGWARTDLSAVGPRPP